MIKQSTEVNVGSISQIASFQPRDVLRHLSLSTLAKYYQWTGQMIGALQRNRIQFLYFHNLLENERESFRVLLEKLSREHRFISYSDAVNRVLSGHIDEPYVALSFDDGLKNCLSAARIMNEFEIKACFFLCPAMIGETNDQRIKEFCMRNFKTPPQQFLSWDDAHNLLMAGHEVGSHTMNHQNLSRLSEQQVKDEIGTSFEALHQQLGEVKHFAWPFGRFHDFDARSARIVFETGFQSCASAERGCHIAHEALHDSELCIRRDNTEARWPLQHVLYFMTRNSQLASTNNNGWPESWT